MSSAKSEFLEWFLGRVADIITLIRGDKRTIGQLLPLKRAIQMTINGEYFETRYLDLKELLQSNEPAHLQEGWRDIYARLKIDCNVPIPGWKSSLVEKERKKGRIPIYLAPEVAYLEGITILSERLVRPIRIPTRGLGWTYFREGWMFVSSSNEPPNIGFSLSEVQENFRANPGDDGRLEMNLNMFMVFMAYQQIKLFWYSPGPQKTCFEVLPGSAYGKDHSVIVEYSDVINFKVHRGKLPDGVMLGARSIVRIEAGWD